MEVEEPAGPASGAKRSTPGEQAGDLQATIMELLTSSEFRESRNRPGEEQAAVAAWTTLAAIVRE